MRIGTISVAYGLNMTTTATFTGLTSPSPSHDPSCADIPRLWTHTSGQGRFTEHTPTCVTVTGKVLSAEAPGTKAGEADGDYHFNILANTPNYSNPENCKQTPSGKNCQELIAEIICYDHKAITLQDANNACQNYQNTIDLLHN
jgi:hypothetical protein